MFRTPSDVLLVLLLDKATLSTVAFKKRVKRDEPSTVPVAFRAVPSNPSFPCSKVFRLSRSRNRPPKSTASPRSRKQGAVPTSATFEAVMNGRAVELA